MRVTVNFPHKFMSSFLIGIFLLSTCIPATLAEEIVHFYHNDHLGSPLPMTDEDGNVAHKDWAGSTGQTTTPPTVRPDPPVGTWTETEKPRSL